MSTDTETKTIEFFTYGTLRKGEGLHGWIQDEVITDRGIVTMPGARLFYALGHKGYPYLVLTDDLHDEAVGELYTLPLNDNIIAMLRMEMNAGYTITESDVLLPDGDMAMAMVCEWPIQQGTGNPVPDNNWLSAERINPWR
jgi:gamma-glutamylcyclotransferase (GGCT)/AIG2-like uncharacterized protein YtfP